jgi:subfamily B ATP-binding cassette protein MsbA
MASSASRPRQELQELFGLLHRLKVKPVHFITAFALSTAAAVLEGASLALLIPLIQGVTTFDFSFIGATFAWQILSRFYEPLRHFSQRDFFLLLAGLVFATAIGKNVFRYLSSVSVAHIARIASHNMRRQIFDTYLGVNKLFFDRHNTGYLNQVLVDFTERVTRPLSEGHQLLNATLAFAVYIIVMFTISWKITLFILVIFPIMIVAQRLLIARIKQRSHRLADSIARFSKSTYNTLTSIPLVMANTTASDEAKKFARASGEVAETEFTITKLQHLIRPVQETITLLTVLVLVIIVAILVQRGHTEASASLLVYFYVLMNAATSFAALQRMQGLIAQAAGPTRVVQEILGQKKNYQLADGYKEFPGLHTGIAFKALAFSYPEGRPILRQLTFTIPRGKMTALVGPTGAGKSTIVNLLMRFYDSPRGALLFDGADIAEFSLRSLRAHIALVSQDTVLFNDTIRANLLYGLPSVSDDALRSAISKARLADFVERLPEGLETTIGDRGVKLSGGEKQRLAIARALLKGAEIILLDEATSALDSRTEKLIQEAIDAAIADKTAVVIAHRLSTIQHADNIVVIEDGQIIEQGRLADLLAKRGAFYRYWEEQKFF